MSGLDEAWELALAEAMRRAHTEGRGDLAGYLDLRAQNDLLRRAAADWLTITFTSLAAVANRHGAGIQIEQKDSHRFRRGTATMVGTQLILRRGVRLLTIEAGWPRAPRDGIVRGDGLACVDIKHLGRPRWNTELLLARDRDKKPQWFVLNENGARSLLTDAHIRQHFTILLSEI
ncbi:MAG: hypothetical protein ACMG6H_05930 [Acidobacteriota bacterium]